MEVTKSCKKVAQKYCCKKCDYNTSRKSSFNKHIITAKHTQLTQGDASEQESCKKQLYTCQTCNKIYMSRNGLWKHNKLCTEQQYNQELVIIEKTKTVQPELSLVMDFVKEYSDCIEEVITCSAFLIHEPLRKRWIKEGQYLEYINGVNFTTKYNTPMDRLERLDRIERLFKKLKIPYSIYNRGLYMELKEQQMREEAENPELENERLERLIEEALLMEDKKHKL